MRLEGRLRSLNVGVGAPLTELADPLLHCVTEPGAYFCSPLPGIFSYLGGLLLDPLAGFGARLGSKQNAQNHTDGGAYDYTGEKIAFIAQNTTSVILIWIRIVLLT